MNQLKIEKVQIGENRIDVLFSTSESITNFFKAKQFWIEYSTPITNVPEGIAVIPFLCNILPTIWIADIEVILPEIDKTFFESIEDIKKGYIGMYPNISFRGKITPEKSVDYRNEIQPEKGSALFFSGGVDAFASLIEHIEEKPDLLTIWGADIALNDEGGWKNVQKHIRETAKLFDLSVVEIKSNFRNILNPAEFGDKQREWSYNYWHRLQHGIAIIGHAAPYAFIEGISTVYIASSFSPKERRNLNYACASDPNIDESVRFLNTKVIHDQALFRRQDKVNKIVDFCTNSKKQVQLRVCWESTGGKNCCACEKCYRTIMGIIASGGDPNLFGFSVQPKDVKNIRKYILYKNIFDWIKIYFWSEIKEDMMFNKALPEYTKETRWVLDCDFNEVNNSILKDINVLIARVDRKIKYIINRGKKQ